MNKQDTKVLFMGTPDIARDCLQQLLDDGWNVIGAFTREDKPVGRKQILTAPPVKELALQHNIPVYQPKTLKGEYSDVIADLKPDMIVVVAYGRILPKAVIDVPQFGCLNLHVSLLPKYRGAAPIQWSLINGDRQTGVTVMHIDEGLDTGDIIDVLPIDIEENETQEELFNKVAEKGKVFLSQVMETVVAGNYTRTPQDHTQATLAPPLTKEMALFDFGTDALTLHNKVRGQNPWPSAHFMYDGKKVKVIKAQVVDKQGKVGEILSTKPLVVATADKALQLITVQPEGSKAMDGTAWAMGRRFKAGDSVL
ncbi:MAG: methionyl-tRNA formyltransferase [Oscillospiraceae bacterium]|nr:methionyl-tRNA formyltransferase [Oscillospiraceae bacterium]